MNKNVQNCEEIWIPKNVHDFYHMKIEYVKINQIGKRYK